MLSYQNGDGILLGNGETKNDIIRQRYEYRKE
jgi:hypothetical protein